MSRHHNPTGFREERNHQAGQSTEAGKECDVQRLRGKNLLNFKWPKVTLSLNSVIKFLLEGFDLLVSL